MESGADHVCRQSWIITTFWTWIGTTSKVKQCCATMDIGLLLNYCLDELSLAVFLSYWPMLCNNDVYQLLRQFNISSIRSKCHQCVPTKFNYDSWLIRMSTSKGMTHHDKLCNHLCNYSRMLFKTANLNTVQDSSSEELFKNTVQDCSSGQ